MVVIIPKLSLLYLRYLAAVQTTKIAVIIASPSFLHPRTRFIVRDLKTRAEIVNIFYFHPNLSILSAVLRDFRTTEEKRIIVIIKMPL